MRVPTAFNKMRPIPGASVAGEESGPVGIAAALRPLNIPAADDICPGGQRAPNSVRGIRP